MKMPPEKNTLTIDEEKWRKTFVLLRYKSITKGTF